VTQALIALDDEERERGVGRDALRGMDCKEGWLGGIERKVLVGRALVLCERKAIVHQ
jgi:hypothetical protein